MTMSTHTPLFPQIRLFSPLTRSLTPLGVLRVVRASCRKYGRDGKRKQRLRADHHALLVHLPPEVTNQCFLTLAVPASDGCRDKRQQKKEGESGWYAGCCLNVSRATDRSPANLEACACKEWGFLDTGRPGKLDAFLTDRDTQSLPYASGRRDGEYNSSMVRITDSLNTWRKG